MKLRSSSATSNKGNNATCPEGLKGLSMAYSCVGPYDIEILHPITLKTNFASREAHRFLDIIESCSPFSARSTVSVLRKYSP